MGIRRRSSPLGLIFSPRRASRAARPTSSSPLSIHHPVHALRHQCSSQPSRLTPPRRSRWRSRASQWPSHSRPRRPPPAAAGPCSPPPAGLSPPPARRRRCTPPPPPPQARSTRRPPPRRLPQVRLPPSPAASAVSNFRLGCPQLRVARAIDDRMLA